MTPKTKAIIPVHLYGMPVDMPTLRLLAEAYGFRVLEDAAQAHGAKWCGGRCGSLADAGAFSFYPTKNLGCLGDGGAVTTDDADLAISLRSLRNYGSTLKYHNDRIGFNSRLDDLQAAVLSEKLRHLYQENVARREIAERYDRAFECLPIGRMHAPPQAMPNWHIYPIMVRNRDVLIQALHARGIGSLIHYPIPPHLQPAYASLGYKRGDFPLTEQMADELVSLPLWPFMPEESQAMVIDVVREHVERRLAA